jgi:hypothetical protein
MISYKASYIAGSKPYLAKVLTIDNQSMEVKLGPSTDHDELDLIPTSSLMEHLNNYVLYIQDETSKLSVFSLNDPAIDSRFPFKGYGPIDDVILESSQWWQYVFFHRDAEEGAPA